MEFLCYASSWYNQWCIPLCRAPETTSSNPEYISKKFGLIWTQYSFSESTSGKVFGKLSICYMLVVLSWFFCILFILCLSSLPLIEQITRTIQLLWRKRVQHGQIKLVWFGLVSSTPYCLIWKGGDIWQFLWCRSIPSRRRKTFDRL